MNRKIGIHGIQQQARTKEDFQKAGEQLAIQQLDQMKTLLETFKSNLQEFAVKHKKDINRDPTFRMNFQRMCSNVGVDPLASNKGFWSDVLGFGDFYFELAVGVAEVCLATRERNGGLIELSQLKHDVERMRGAHAQTISEDDIVRSIKSLAPLGNGFDIIKIGGRTLVQSVPRELNLDFTTVLNAAQASGFVTVQKLQSELGWEEERALKALQNLIRDGICWIDEQSSPTSYWIAGLFQNTD